MSRSLTLTWQDPMPLCASRTLDVGTRIPARGARWKAFRRRRSRRLVGMKLAEVEEGHAVLGAGSLQSSTTTRSALRTPASPRQLLDSAMACAGALHASARQGLHDARSSRSILVRGVTLKSGKLRAIGKLVHSGRTTATAEARLEDASGTLYAHGSTTCIILGA
jgi:acyl-coenzyme A thioesterase PaaI-like protein